MVRRLPCLALAAAALLPMGCDGETPDPQQPEGWSDDIAPPAVAEDLDPAPDVVEVELVAEETLVETRPGVMTSMYAYNGSVPGPTIEAEVGDTLIVHFENRLDEPTTIHWHGVELPAVMDGSHIAQPLVEPGETFTYEFELREPALYWYHPHVRTNVQVERGLHGALVVHDPQAVDDLELPEDELVLVLDDLLLAGDGQVAQPYPDDPETNAAVQLNGREGDVILVNGRELPTARVRSGAPVRLRVVNVANSRFFRLSVPGHVLYEIGTDGGLLTEAEAKDPIALVERDGAMISDPDPRAGVLLVPGQRTDVVFTPSGDVGDTITLESHDTHRGRHSVSIDPRGEWMIAHGTGDGDAPPVPLARFEIVEGSSGARAWTPPPVLREIERIDTADADTLNVTFGHALPDENGDVVFFATMVEGVGGVPFDELTADQALQAEVGGTYVYEVHNLTGGDHPFHPHGFFFQPIEIEYVDMDDPRNNRIEPWPRLENRDTIRVPERPGARGRSRTIARLAVRYDDTGREGQVEAWGKDPTADRSGGWLVHCHILEHADRGMMTFLNLR